MKKSYQNRFEIVLAFVYQHNRARALSGGNVQRRYGHRRRRCGSGSRRIRRETTGEARLKGRKTANPSPAEAAIYRASSLRWHLRPNWIAKQAPMGGPCLVPPRASGECRSTLRPIIARPQESPIGRLPPTALRRHLGPDGVANAAFMFASFLEARLPDMKLNRCSLSSRRKSRKSPPRPLHVSAMVRITR